MNLNKLINKILYNLISSGYDLLKGDLFMKIREEKNKDNKLIFGKLHISITLIFLSMIVLLGLIIGYMQLNKTFALSETFFLKEGVLKNSKEVEESDDDIENQDNNEENKVEDENIIEEEPGNMDEEVPSTPIFSSYKLENLISHSVPEGKVALTFDDGPSKYTIDIINVLKEYNVGSTFFFIGKHIYEFPEYVKEVHSNGFAIGSHSMSHINLKKLSIKKQEYEIMESIKMIEDIIEDKIHLFRAPFGNFNSDSEKLLKENNYKMVLWNNDPKDWKTKDGKKIYKAITKHDLSGQIILLHESKETLDILPNLIEYIQEQGLDIVNLD